MIQLDIVQRLQRCLRFDEPTDLESELESAAREAINEIMRLRSLLPSKVDEKADEERRFEIGCPLCLGDGRCPQCQGVGYFDATHDDCSMCDGTCLCPECHGHGA